MRVDGSDCHRLCDPHRSRVGYRLHLCDPWLTRTLSTGWREPTANPQQTCLQKNAVAGLGNFILFHVLLILIFFVYLGSIYVLQQRGEFGWGVMRKMGPNDVSDASFGPKVGGFILLYVLLILTNFFCLSRFYLHYKTTGKVWLGCNEENGPKQRVLRCLGQRYVFFILFCVLHNLTNIFCLFRFYSCLTTTRFYSCSKMVGRVQLGSDNKNGPKQCVLRRLGHRYVIFILFHV